ncbi:MAG: endonuclease III [Synergistaceae bacterium]|nr:endonuclease III [Synergistaceae bacterium]
MILKILDALEILYHNEENPPNLKHSEPLDGLILTVLSQNTNDKNRDRAFENLKANFPTWADVVEAGASRLEDVIRVAGLAHTKSARIIEILRKVREDFGDYSLKGLMTPPALLVREYLRGLPGVGAKTAACVLLFEFGLKAFPVDTHITRIARRTGIADVKAKPEEISELFESVVPTPRCLGGHVNLIEHGRKVCRAQRPLCENCIVNIFCNRKGLINKNLSAVSKGHGEVES